MMDFRCYSSCFLDNRAYAYFDGEDAVLIDTIFYDSLFDDLHSHNIRNVTVILTHEHFDHLLGVERLRQEFNCRLIASEIAAKNLLDSSKNLSAYAEYLEQLFQEKQQTIDIPIDIRPFSCSADITFVGEYVFDFRNLKFRLVSTPGHSMGSICVLQYVGDRLEKIFTGDSLLRDYPIYTKIPGGNKKIFSEITKPFLLSLSSNIVFYPGHGAYGQIKDVCNKINEK